MIVQPVPLVLQANLPLFFPMDEATEINFSSLLATPTGVIKLWGPRENRLPHVLTTRFLDEFARIPSRHSRTSCSAYNSLSTATTSLVPSPRPAAGNRVW